MGCCDKTRRCCRPTEGGSGSAVLTASAGTRSTFSALAALTGATGLPAITAVGLVVLEIGAGIVAERALVLANTSAFHAGSLATAEVAIATVVGIRGQVATSTVAVRCAL